MASMPADPYCTLCGHDQVTIKQEETPLCGCSCHSLASSSAVKQLTAALNDYESLKRLRSHLQAENSRVTAENRQLQERLAKLAELCLLFIGQHLWQAKIQAAHATACICIVCEHARRTYELITGNRPLTIEEEEAVSKFAHDTFETKFRT